MRIFFSSTRYSTTWVLGLIVAVLSVLVALTSRREGVDLWSDIMTGLSQASIFTGVLTAGFCAFESSRWVSPAAHRLSGAVRSPLTARFLHATAVIAPILLGYLGALAVLTVTGAISGRYGSAYIPWVCVLVSSIIAAGAFGYAIGTMLGKKWYVAPLAAVLFLALYVCSRLVAVPYGVKSLFPVVVNTDSVFVRYFPATMIGQTLVFIGSAALLLCLVRFERRRFTVLMSVLVATAVVAVGVGVTTVLRTNGQYTTGHNTRDFVCEESVSDATICVNRGYAAALPKLREQFALLNSRVAGTELVATRLEQHVEGVGDDPAPGARSVYLEENNDVGIAVAAARYVAKYGGIHACEVRDEESMERFFAVSAVNAWITGYDELGISELATGVPGKNAYDRLVSMETDDVRRWFRDTQAEYMSCRLTFADFP